MDDNNVNDTDETQINKDGKNNDEPKKSSSGDDSDVSTTIIPANWIEINDEGKFLCSECENEVEPETNTEDGTVKADLAKIKEELKQYPDKVIYGICPVCGMEFVFKYANDKLYLEPSEMIK